MSKLGSLKNAIERKALKEKKTQPNKPAGGLKERIDMDRVDQIVEKMKRKYREQGLEFEEVGGKLGRLRGIIAEEAPEFEFESPEQLTEFSNPIVARIGSIYLMLRGIAEPLSRLLKKLPSFDALQVYLYSANMRYSARQWLALASGASLVVFILTLVVSSAFVAILVPAPGIEILLVPIVSFAAMTLSAVTMMLIPQLRAKQRGDAVSIELPFALRHMATELRAGIGLYRTIQAIAVADYGPLSEEFARAINEIEGGTDAREALNHLALRTQSKALRTAIMHIVRAMKTGGNLSGIMNEIAENVSFEMTMRLREFSQRMNFFGVIFIFAAIVLPVMIAVLGGIRNSPLEAGTISFKALPLGPEAIAAIYLFAIPALLILFIFYIYSSQPRL